VDLNDDPGFCRGTRNEYSKSYKIGRIICFDSCAEDLISDSYNSPPDTGIIIVVEHQLIDSKETVAIEV
jgi:hypothetical protein